MAGPLCCDGRSSSAGAAGPHAAGDDRAPPQPAPRGATPHVVQPRLHCGRNHRAADGGGPPGTPSGVEVKAAQTWHISRFSASCEGHLGQPGDVWSATHQFELLLMSPPGEQGGIRAYPRWQAAGGGAPVPAALVSALFACCVASRRDGPRSLASSLPLRSAPEGTGRPWCSPDGPRQGMGRGEVSTWQRLGSVARWSQLRLRHLVSAFPGSVCGWKNLTVSIGIQLERWTETTQVEQPKPPRHHGGSTFFASASCTPCGASICMASGRRVSVLTADGSQIRAGGSVSRVRECVQRAGRPLRAVVREAAVREAAVDPCPFRLTIPGAHRGTAGGWRSGALRFGRRQRHG
jgi:hypothetical protein